MSEKVTIFEVDISMDKAVLNIQKSTDEIEKLKNEIKKLTETEGKNSKAVIKKNALLKAEQKELRTNTKLTVDAVSADKAKNGSIKEMRKALSIVADQWADLSKEERENSKIGKQLTKQKKELTELLKEEEKATGDNTRNVGNYGGALGQVSEQMSSSIPGFDKAKTAMQGFNTVVKLNPLGLLITALTLIVSAFGVFFSKTEEGQQKMKQFTAVLSAGIDLLTAAWVGLAETLMNPLKAIEDYKAAAQDFSDKTVNKIFGGALDWLKANFSKTFATIGLSWQELKGVFVDNSKGITAAQKDVVDATEQIIDAEDKMAEGLSNSGDAWDSAVSKVVDFVEEIKTATKESIAFADAQNKLEKDTIASITSLAKLNGVIEKQTAIADNNVNSWEVRKKAQETAQKATEDYAKTELNLAKQESDIVNTKIKKAKEQGLATNDLYREQAETNEKLIIAQNDYTNKVAENAKLRDEINRDEFEKNLDYMVSNLTSTISTNSEKLANEKILFDEKKAILEQTKAIAEKGFNDQIAQLQTRTAQTINTNALISESDGAVLLEKVRLLQLGEVEETRLLEVIQERRTAEKDLSNLAVEINQNEIDRKNAADLLNATNKLETKQSHVLAQFDIDRANVAIQQETELIEAEKIGADTSLINQKYAKKNAEINKTELNAKADLTKNTLNDIAVLAGEGSEVGKAAAAGAATISAIQGATAAFSSLAPVPLVGPALGAIAAAAALVSGYKNVKAIYSVDTGSKGKKGKKVSTPAISKPSMPNIPKPGAADSSKTDSTNMAEFYAERNEDIAGNNNVAVIVDEVTSKQNVQSENENTAVL